MLNAIDSFIKIILKLFVLILLLFVALAFFSSPSSKSSVNLVELEIHGPIMDIKEWMQEIDDLLESPQIKGVLINIDSPGGGLSQSIELSDAIARLVEQKKVIAYVSGTMASGSLYAALSAPKIIANRGAVIGSIGVLTSSIDASELLDKIGLKDQSINSGKYKQAGTPMRPWNDYEKEFLQKLSDDSYSLFTRDVARARKLDTTKLSDWADAKVFLAHEALKLGLIDEVSDYYGAKIQMAQMVENPTWAAKKKTLMQQIKSELGSMANFVAKSFAQGFAQGLSSKQELLAQ